MIVRLSVGSPPELLEHDRFDELRAETSGPLEDVDLGDLVRVDEDGIHVWLRTERLRALLPTDDPHTARQFEGMVQFAVEAGFADADGTELRAHLT